MSDEFVSLPSSNFSHNTNILKREASDDTEADVFKSADNGTDASDDEEAPAKKSKTNSAANSKGKTMSKTSGKSTNKSSVKVEDEEEENKTIHDKGYENAFGGDDGTEVVDYA